MCPRHQSFIQALPTGDDHLVERTAAETQTDPDAERERNTGGHALRHRHHHTLYETPEQDRTFRGPPRKKFCSSGSDFEPSPDSQMATTSSCEQAKAGIRLIAAAVGITDIKFPAKFLPLEPSTKAKRVNAACHITDAVMSVFAPDAPNQMKKMVCEKDRGEAWGNKKHSGKFTGIVEDAIEQYMNATSRQARLQMLGVIAPWFKWKELEKFIPGLTSYTWKEARRFSKTFKSGLVMPEASRIRERYDKKKVIAFLQFLTSPEVASELPFGEVTVRDSKGEKREIPNLLRTSVNSRIIQQYKVLMEYRRASHLVMSDSTMMRILKTCKATTRKSMKGIDYLTYEGMVMICFVP